MLGKETVVGFPVPNGNDFISSFSKIHASVCTNSTCGTKNHYSCHIN